MYALGVSLFYMLFGKYPFYGEDQQSMTTLYKNNKPFEFPRDIPIQSTCKVLITKLLEREKEERIDNHSPYFKEWYDDKE